MCWHSFTLSKSSTPHLTSEYILTFPVSLPTKLDQQFQVYVTPVPDPQALDMYTLAISWEGTGHTCLSTSHTPTKSATVVSTVPLLPHTHCSMMALSTVVSKSTSCRSQPITANRTGAEHSPMDQTTSAASYERSCWIMRYS